MFLAMIWMHEVTFNSLIVKLAASVVDRGFHPQRLWNW